jgi:folate-binding protein YgfZ
MHKILVPHALTDNLPPIPQAFALPCHAIIALEGPDAIDLAQAQFANDVRALPPGHWQWNAWLTPKGRVIALFALLRVTENRSLLLLPDTPAPLMAEQLRRYVFRRKVKIDARGDLFVQAAFAAPTVALGSQLAMDGENIELDFSGEGGARVVRIGTVPVTEDAQAAARWFAFDLAHGLPRLPESQREQWTPQQLSLQRLPAFSVKKGCYPGQEIVARTHFLGQAKRELVLLQADTPLVAGDGISAGGANVGVIVSSAGHTALAVALLERESTPLQANGVDVRELPLQDGLQR